MERHIGMDVHAASCTLAVNSDKGRKLKDFPVETNGQALVEAVRMIPGHKHLVMEEGLQSAWLYETLSPHVGVGARIEIGRQLRHFRNFSQAPIAKESGRPRTIIRFKMLQAISASTSCDCR